MRALIEQCGLADRVWLLGLRDDMPAVYPTLDVLVSTSHSEAMPLAVMEAMACGVPVVATRVGGVPDLVAHGHTGWLVSPGNFEGIAQQVASLIEQPPLRAQMGRCARERAMHSFELRHNVARVGQLLTRLGTPGGVALGGPRRLP
jgi:glycosyltransferase involved in cell wall biosynthesis